MEKLLEQIEEISFPANILKLDNGLTLIHQYMPTTPVVVADVWVDAGASAEPENWWGMAHFLEHMIFKGSKQVKPGEFDWAIENSGGITNAATSHDYAHFFITTAANNLPNNLSLLADILLQAAIPDDEFYRERDVVLEEIRGCYDDPDWIGFQALSETIYQHHPYRRSVLGEETDVAQHTPNQMRCFHRTHYQPENMTVALVGGVEREDALSLTTKVFADFSVRSECPPMVVDAEPPMTGIRRTEIYLPRIEQARLSLAWLGPGVERLEDALGLDLLAAILAGGSSSRLVRELREEKQLIMDIDSDFSLQRDSSLFTISAWLESERVEQVEEIIRSRIAQLQATPVTELELARCKRLLCNDYAFSTETPGQLAGLYGYYNTIAKVELAAIYPHQIQKFDRLTLQRIASQYLSSDRYAVTILKPC